MTIPRIPLGILLVLLATVFWLAACEPAPTPEDPPAPEEPETEVTPEAEPEEDPGPDQDEAFEEFSERLVEAWMERNPEWAIRAGRYENAHEVTIPDEARRQETLEFNQETLEELDGFDPDRLSPLLRADYELIRNRLESDIWYQEEFRGWQWNPSQYNVAGPIGVLLTTEYAPLDERMTTILQRLKRIPDYYRAARENIREPTREHIELAIQQNRGALSVINGDLSGQLEDSGLSEAAQEEFSDELDNASEAIEEWIGWLQNLEDELEGENGFREYRIGEELYERKFALDIQSEFSARELYERALEEKQRLHADMDEQARELWPEYFEDEEMPDEPLERIARLIDHLSDRHVDPEDFVDEIRRQIPKLEAFVDEHELVDQDPSRPLVVRETPEYMRGTGARASINAPGPFNPEAETYYNVTPLDDLDDDQVESFLREYNHWVLQVLNIHEAIPGHYTQLLHANKSPSVIKSLLGNGAMIEGWAVYAERMMLEEGWGDHEPEMWLMYGKWALRVVTNAILDYAVQVKGMEEDEALDMLRNKAFQESTEAHGKWRRLTLSQVQLTSYFTGFAEIYDFREQEKQRLGEDFDLKTFHNEFLSFGSAPVSVIIDLMTGEEEWIEADPDDHGFNGD